MNTIEIKEEFELDVKRFRMPIKIEGKCPKCNKKYYADLNGNHYISYPTVNAIEKIYFNCQECDIEFELDVILNISLQISDTSRII